MSSLPGTWNLALRTPIGTLHAEMTFSEREGVWTGAATDGDGQRTPLREIRTRQTPDGEHVTWSQTVTRPMRLELDFEVTVAGERMTGYSRAGRLPRTAVLGTRRADRAS